MRVTCIRPTYVMFPELVPFIAARAQNLPSPPGTAHPDPTVVAALKEPLSLLRSYVEPGDVARLIRLALEHVGASSELFYGITADSLGQQPASSFLHETRG